jgi:hypothetical protein
MTFDHDLSRRTSDGFDDVTDRDTPNGPTLLSAER